MNKGFVFLSIFFFALTSFADSHVKPVATNFNSETLNVRFFKKYDNNKVMLELEKGTQYDSLVVAHIKLGSYYKLGDGEKLGYFISRNLGKRHTNDWMMNQQTSVWEWQDTSDRTEDIVHLSYSKRFKPSLKTPLILDLKGELEYNSYNQQQLFVFLPGINYFFLKKGIPNFSLHFSTPIYFPLNFEQNTIYKYGAYSGLLYHAQQNIQIGLNFKLLYETWTDSDDLKLRNPSKSYEITDSQLRTRIEFIYLF